MLDVRAAARRGSPCVEQHRRVAVGCAVRRELPGRPREQQPVQRGPPVRVVGAQAGAVVVGQLGDAASARPARPAPGCGTARASRRAGRPARRAGSRSPSPACRTARGRPRSPSASTPAPTRCSARSPTTFDDGVTLTIRPEHPVRGGVVVLDQLEPVAEPERDRLLAQVGQLPAGDLVGVDAPGRRREARLERRVDLAHGLPVGLQVARPPARSRPVAPRRVVGRRDQRGQRRLAGGARHRGDRRVDRVHAGVDRGESAWRAGRRRCRGCAGATGRSNRSRSAVTSVAGRRRRAAARPCP